MRNDRAVKSPRKDATNPGARLGCCGTKGWLVHGSSLALATALAVLTPGPSAAQTVAPRVSAVQAVQATPTVALGNASVARSATADQVRFTTTENIINWATLDTATLDTTSAYVNFLPAGTRVEYLGPTGGYTVLNRIFPTVSGGRYRGVAIEGSVLGTLITQGRVGNIWFYSPGGILATGTASFNVGGLLLTTSNIDAIGSGGNQMSFAGVSDPASQVIVQSGATITATSGSNYVAMFAPRVQQGGSVTVNGSAAYVAAEAGQLTIDNGLFDIAVTLGSGDGNGIVHTGTTTGPASQAIVDGSGNVTNADAQAIYLVGIPKNTAMTMLVGGALGYQPASSAARTPNGQIVLSAGAEVSATGALASPQIAIDKAGASSVSSNIQLDSATFRSSVTGYAGGTVDALMDSGQTLSMGSDARGAYDLSLEGRNRLTYGTAVGGVSNVAGNVTLRAGADQAIGGAIDVRVAGGASIPSGSSHASVGGTLALDTSGVGRDDYGTKRDNGNSGNGQDAIGGPITISVSDNGSLAVGTLLANASAQGGKGESRSGSARAGSIDLTLSSGSVTVTGDSRLNAGALSAEEGEPGALAEVGADGTAGGITVNLAGGRFDAAALTLVADGSASDGDDAAIAQSNDATAGSVAFNVTGGDHSFDTVSIGASATAGQSFDSAGTTITGNAGRGSVVLAVANANTTLTVGGDLFVTAGTSGAVADPLGNTVDIRATAPGDAAGLFVGGGIFVDASAGNGSDTATTAAGTILLAADNSQISFGTLSLDANASPSGLTFFTEGSGVDYRGGSITLRSANGASIAGGDAYVEANATGGALVGGRGTGGSVTVLADGGTIDIEGFAFVSANGRGGVGGRVDDPSAKGIGVGGTVNFTVAGPAGAMNFGDLFVEADGAIFVDSESGSAAFEGDGGAGMAGLVAFDIDGGTFSGGQVSVSASGYGGLGGELLPMSVGTLALSSDPIGEPAGSGGDGTGGTVAFNLNGGNATVASLAITATGVGGDGGSGDFNAGTYGGSGGNAFGGTATFNAVSGNLTVANALTVEATGNTGGIFGGGRGGDARGDRGGDGGQATGGTATFDLAGSASITAGSVVVSTDAFGGPGGSSFATADLSDNPVPSAAGGNGGAAQAGTATFNNTAGSIGFGTLTVQANGSGGSGGSSVGLAPGEAANLGGGGGSGTGGSATINLNQDDLTGPAYVIAAQGFGGSGGTGLDGGAGGLGSGGTAGLNVNDAAVSLGSLSIIATSFGGSGGATDANAGSGGAGGDGRAGSAILDTFGAGASFASNSPVLLEADGYGGGGAAGAANPSGTGSGGAGGDAGGGTGGLIRVVSRQGATLDLAFDDELNARGFGGAGGAGGNAPLTFVPGEGGAGGDATGGTIELTSSSGAALNVSGGGGEGRLNAYATGGAGGNGGTGGSAVGTPGRNGAAQGGAVNLAIDSILSFDGSPYADASARGFSDTRPGARGSSALGGAISISVGGGGDFSATGTLTATVEAFGGIGADGSGGSVDIVNGGAFAVPSILVAASGTGGTGADTAVGGAGGIGRGGTVQLSSSSTFVDLGLIDISATGSGGSGGTNASSGAVGGAGGNGQGGSASVEFTGPDGTIDAATNLAFDVGGMGAAGGSGQGDPTSDAAFGGSGDGGGGGNGIGGSITLAARSGATFVVPASASNLTASGTGGAGGNGGNNSAASVRPPGDGGAGGRGTGGSLSLVAEGGTISGDAVSLAANGIGGPGGGGGAGGGPGAGFDACVEAGFTTCAGGASGTSGEGAGGSIALSALEGSPAVISLGSTSLEANAYMGLVGQLGGVGGTIAISDTSIDPGGLISFGSLTASALGTIGVSNRGFFLSGDSGPIAVANDLTVDVAGNIAFDFDGTGQLTTGGDAVLDARIDFVVAHTNNVAPTRSIDSSGAFLATAGGLFEAQADSIIASGTNMSIRAQGVSFGTLLAGGALAIEAGDILGGSATGNGITARASGTFDVDEVLSNGALTIEAATIAAQTVESLGAATLTASGGDLAVSGRLAAGGALAAQSSGAIAFGDAVVDGDASLIAGGAIALGDLAGDFLTLDAGGAIDSGAITGLRLEATGTRIGLGPVTIGSNALAASGSLLLSATDGGITLGQVRTNRSIELDAANAIQLSTVNAGGSVVGDAGGAVAFTSLTGEAITFTSGSSIIGSGVSVPTDTLGSNQIVLTAGGAVSIETISGIGDVSIDAVGAITSNSINGSFNTLLSDAAVNAGAVTGIGLEARAPSVDIDSADITANALAASGRITLDASAGAARIGSANSARDTSVTGRSVTIGGGTIGGNLVLNASAGNIVGNGTTTVGGAIDLDATADINVGSLTAQGGGFTANAGGSFVATTARASGNLAIDAADTISLAMAAGDGVAIRSAGGSVVVSNDLASSSATSTVLVSGTSVRIDDANGLRISTVRATVGSVDLRAGGAIDVGEADASGGINLTSTGGGVRVGRAEAGLGSGTESILVRSAGDADLSLAAGGNIDISAGGAARLTGSSAGTELLLTNGGTTEIAGAVTAGSEIVISSGGDLAIVGGGSLIAGTALDLDTGGLFSASGTASGQIVAVRAMDFDLASGSRLGDATTTELIEITSRGAPIFLGGSGKEGHFSIGNDEFSGIHSGGDLSIIGLATGTADPEITIGDLDVAVGTGVSPTDGNFGRDSTFLLNAEIEGRIEGSLAVVGVGPQTRVLVSASDRILLETATGNVGLLDGSGNPAGDLLVSAPFVGAMSSAAFGDIQGMALADIDARLAEGDGIDREDGFFQAGNLTFEVADGLFIQNSGTGTQFDARRGFVSDTLTINGLVVTLPTAASATGARIVINGIVGGQTGVSAIPVTVVNADFQPASTINGCLIANPAACSPTPTQTHGPANDARDLIEEEIAAEDTTTVTGPIEAPLIEIDEPAEYADDPLIDDPITGAGNEDLWTSDPACPPDGGEGECGSGP